MQVAILIVIILLVIILEEVQWDLMLQLEASGFGRRELEAQLFTRWVIILILGIRGDGCQMAITR